MHLTGERVTIREFQPADATAYYDYASDPAVTEPAGMQPVQTPTEARLVIDHFRAHHDGLAIDVGGQLVGHIALYERSGEDGGPDPTTREIGYALAPAAWGHGYMTEALALLLPALAAQGIETVWAMVLVTNHPSIRVLARAGFTPVGEVPVPASLGMPAQSREMAYVRDLEK